jgi:hypothetical protein
VWTDAEINAHINLAQRYTALRLDKNYLPQLTQTTNLVFAGVNKDLPSDFLKMAGDPVNATSGAIYPLMTIGEAHEYVAHNLDSDSLFTGRIVSWLQNQDLYLSSTVTATVILPYVKYPADLSADGDASTIEEGVIDLVIQKAAADALIKTRQLQESALLLKALEQRIEVLNRSV